jgi:uncharacterized protein YjaG (DUF416 family)
MSDLKPDPAQSYLSLGYCAALVESMYPNYGLFCQAVNIEGEKIYRNALNVVWEYASGRTQKIDFFKQQEKFEAYIPEPGNYELYGVRPALDACVGLTLLLQSCDAPQDDDTSSLVTLSNATIEHYLTATEYDGELQQHPLFLRQAVLLDNLDSKLSPGSGDRRSLVDELRALGSDEGLSNIGISLQGE